VLPESHPTIVAAAARSCAAGGELEQIQMLLGHASVQTTERYLGTKQDLVHVPNDGIKLKLAVQCEAISPAFLNLRRKGFR